MTDALAAATQAEQDAAEAQNRLQEARQRAEAARQHAEAERAAKMRDYLNQVTEAYPAAHAAATKARGEAREALVSAVRDGGDVFCAYLAWVTESVAVWEIADELAGLRYYHGQGSRDMTLPVFSFTHDIGEIVGQLAGQMQDAATQRIQDRRAAFLAEEERS